MRKQKAFREFSLTISPICSNPFQGETGCLTVRLHLELINSEPTIHFKCGWLGMDKVRRPVKKRHLDDAFINCPQLTTTHSWHMSLPVYVIENQLWYTKYNYILSVSHSLLITTVLKSGDPYICYVNIYYKVHEIIEISFWDILEWILDSTML